MDCGRSRLPGGGILDLPPVGQARTALGAEAWDAAYAAGRALSREEVFAEAWREARGEPEEP